jgi:hypothetical protein
MTYQGHVVRALLFAACVCALGCGEEAVPKLAESRGPSTSGDGDDANSDDEDTEDDNEDPDSDESDGQDDSDAPGDTDDPDDTEDPDTDGNDAGAEDDPDETPVSEGGACLQGITTFAQEGPFKYTAKTHGQVKMWVPMVPAGCKVPVIHLANGTGATCSSYRGSLTRMASHGFLATCYESTQTGAGTQGIQAFEAAFKEYPDLADVRLGSTGHSQGGQAAFTVLQLAEAKWGSERIYAGLAMQPASGFGSQPSGGTWQQVYAKIKSPMFMFSGTRDTLVSESWVKRGFDALSDQVEAYWWSAIGATHIPTPDPQQMEISVPWFRWKLLGDKAACEHFKKMNDGTKWEQKAVQNEVDCD